MNWLKEHKVEFEDRHIVENNPTAEELKEWHENLLTKVKTF